MPLGGPFRFCPAPPRPSSAGLPLKPGKPPPNSSCHGVVGPIFPCPAPGRIPPLGGRGALAQPPKATKIFPLYPDPGRCMKQGGGKKKVRWWGNKLVPNPPQFKFFPTLLGRLKVPLHLMAIGGSWWEKLCDHGYYGSTIAPPHESTKTSRSSLPFLQSDSAQCSFSDLKGPQKTKIFPFWGP